MDGRYDVGVVGLVHDHVWGLLKEFQSLPNVRVTCAADINEPLLRKVQAEHGVRSLYRDYRELLRSERVQICLVCTENSRHTEVTEVAAERQVHILVEKPMSANLEQAERMLRAARKADVKLLVNYPTSWNPRIREAHALAAEGALGKPFLLRFRAAHQGPKEIGCSPYFYE